MRSFASLRYTALLALVSLAAPVDAQSRGRASAPSTTAAPVDSSLADYAGMPWRNIGPSRGGRSNAVSGVPGMPLTYFAGYTGGGLWRTDDAGISWRNLSDGSFRVGTIGAIAVAPSDHNVIYVGSGEHAIRGQSSSYGDGMYKSTDFGRTWTHIGLDATRQISAVRVHPQDANVVYVAAQGDRWQGSADRGIYRSKDGGATWQLVLKGQNPTSGASDLSMDPSNPRILYAAFWDHQRQPWYVRSGGAGSGLWKSTDGGDTWTRLSGGLPSLMGKIGVSVSPLNPDRVFAIVEAEQGGLYRSDDAGRSWRRLSGDRLIQTRSWYYMKVFADPGNENTVWVLNAPIMRSIDGGATFQTVNATHGDNHALWIDPQEPNRIINGNDGGASVSLDGSKSWSSQDNQPTAQFYHVTVDAQFPYRLYSGQQDNSSVSIASRTDGGSIGIRDWNESAGCESANIGVGKSGRYVYGGCYQGLINELDTETGLTRSIMVYPQMTLTERTDSTKYRFNWTAPIRVSQHDERTIYYGGNRLFRTNDRGTTWAEISPDLTKNDRARLGWGGGPITNEGAGGEVYATIVVIAESPHDKNVLYVGTDDGLIQRTADGGATWTNITPAGVGDGLVNEIEVSPHDANTVYLAFRKDRVGDNTPHIFRSTDAGRTWTRLVDGLRANEPVRVVREDPARRGLLYAGTETGAYFSIDNGARWQPFTRLPTVPVTDLDASTGDLVASTEGRAFWILDNLVPLQQRTADVAAAPVHLFRPREAYMTPAGGGFGGGGGTPRVGANPPAGAILDFAIKRSDSTQRVTLEILDDKGAVIRRFRSDTTGRARLAVRNGLNRHVWDMRYEGPTQLPSVVLFGSPPGGGGPKVMPGRYTAKLTVGDVVQTQPVDLLRDPRLGPPANPRAIALRDSVARTLNSRIGEIHDYVLRLRDIRTQTQGIVQRSATLAQADSVKLLGGRVTAGTDRFEPRLTTKAGNGQDIINYANGINGQFGFLLGEVEEHPEITASARQRLDDVEVLWRTLRAQLEQFEAGELAAFNAFLTRNGLPTVLVPAPKPPAPIM